MKASITGAVDVTSFAISWSPRLLRFFYLLCANRKAAESLAIETLVEIAKAERWKVPFAVVRLALAKGSSIAVSTEKDNDRVACAVASLPRSQGCIIALVRGMGLGVSELAAATQTSISTTQRALSEALLELHRTLQAGALHQKEAL